MLTTGAPRRQVVCCGQAGEGEGREGGAHPVWVLGFRVKHAGRGQAADHWGAQPPGGVLRAGRGRGRREGGAHTPAQTQGRGHPRVKQGSGQTSWEGMPLATRGSPATRWRAAGPTQGGVRSMEGSSEGQARGHGTRWSTLPALPPDGGGGGADGWQDAGQGKGGREAAPHRPGKRAGRHLVGACGATSHRLAGWLAHPQQQEALRPLHPHP